MAATLQATASKLLADHYTWDAIAAATIGVYMSAFPSNGTATTLKEHA